MLNNTPAGYEGLNDPANVSDLSPVVDDILSMASDLPDHEIEFLLDELTILLNSKWITNGSKTLPI